MKRFQEKDLKEMADILKHDGVLSVPTDTVYGLCARIQSNAAYEKLVKIKQRPPYKSFPIMCAEISQIKEIAILNPNAEKVIEHFMPGPVSIILLKKEDAKTTINNAGLKETDEILFRIAPNHFLKKLIEEVGSPIFMTSANLSDEKVCMSIEEIEEKLPDIDGVLEQEISSGLPSTIINCISDTIKIQREGPVSLEDILEVLKK